MKNETNITQSYKPMVYSNRRLRPSEVLCLAKYKDFIFFVLNMGTHPTAYVQIPENHPYFGKDYEGCNPPHNFLGGPFTFADSSTVFAEKLDTPIPDGWYLGWDYAHLGDWLGYRSDEENLQQENRKYTTEEIIIDCETVIEHLIEVAK